MFPSERPVIEESEWPVFLERIGELGAWMAEQGVSIAFHHHMVTVIETASEIDRLMQDTPDSVGLVLDMGHLTFAGEDPAVVARKWAARQPCACKGCPPGHSRPRGRNAGAFSIRWSRAFTRCQVMGTWISSRR